MHHGRKVSRRTSRLSRMFFSDVEMNTPKSPDFVIGVIEMKCVQESSHISYNITTRLP